MSPCTVWVFAASFSPQKRGWSLGATLGELGAALWCQPCPACRDMGMYPVHLHFHMCARWAASSTIPSRLGRQRARWNETLALVSELPLPTLFPVNISCCGHCQSPHGVDTPVTLGCQVLVPCATVHFGSRAGPGPLLPQCLWSQALPSQRLVVLGHG